MSLDPVVIQTQGLTRNFGKQKALSDVSLSVREKDIYGILGGNGSGKTTLFRMMLGLIWPSSGTISIHGRQVLPTQSLILSRVGAVFEKHAFSTLLSAKDHIKMIQASRGIKNKASIDQVLTLVGLSKRADECVGNYSFGMKQRLAIAEALTGSVDVLILDEPFKGLDPVGAQDLWKIILTLNHEKNMTILFSSHITADLEKYCTRIGILHQGELKFQGHKEELVPKRKAFELRFKEPEKVLEVLMHLENIRILNRMGEYVTLEAESEKDLQDLFSKHQISPLNKIDLTQKLETGYLDLVGHASSIDGKTT
jgi:ABC-type multidrug transport system ATPase subunit